MSAPRCTTVIIIVVGLLRGRTGFDVGITPIDVVNLLPSRQTLSEANPPALFTSDIHQPLLSQFPRDTPGFCSSVLCLIPHSLNFGEGVLGFINLPLSLLQLHLVQLQLFCLLLQRVLRLDPSLGFFFQPNRRVCRPAFRIIRALFLLGELRGQRLSPLTKMGRPDFLFDQHPGELSAR